MYFKQRTIKHTIGTNSQYNKTEVMILSDVMS